MGSREELRMLWASWATGVLPLIERERQVWGHLRFRSMLPMPCWNVDTEASPFSCVNPGRV